MRRTDLCKAVRSGVFALFLAAAPLAGSALAQTNTRGNANSNIAVVTDARDADDGGDWDWLNWLGLLGLLGLLPRKPEVVHVRSTGRADVRR